MTCGLGPDNSWLESNYNNSTLTWPWMALQLLFGLTQDDLWLDMPERLASSLESTQWVWNSRIDLNDLCNRTKWSVTAIRLNTWFDLTQPVLHFKHWKRFKWVNDRWFDLPKRPTNFPTKVLCLEPSNSVTLGEFWLHFSLNNLRMNFDLNHLWLDLNFIISDFTC